MYSFSESSVSAIGFSEA